MNRLEPASSTPPTTLLPGELGAGSRQSVAWGLVGCCLGFTLLFSTIPILGSTALWTWPLGWALFGLLRASATPRTSRVVHHSIGLSTLFVPWLSPLLFDSTPLLGWGQNQTAGALVLFLPFWWIAARCSTHSLARYFFAALSLCALIRLWQLQSRGAWLASTLAILILCGLTSQIELRRIKSIVAKLAPATLITALLMPNAAQRALEALVLEGQLKGPSLEAALSGRPAIWWRSVVAWSDVPFGAGLGSSQRILSQLYPGAIPDPGHAHQQWLQLGLELGWLGLGSWLLLWIVCLRPLWRSAGHRLGRAPLPPEQAAPIAAWLGWLTFGLADCLPAAELSSFGLWTLLAWTATCCGNPSPAPLRDESSEDSSQISRRAGWFVGLPLLAGMLLLLGSIPEDLRHRRAVRALLETASSDDQHIVQGLSSPSSTHGDLWLAALLSQKMAGPQIRENAWRRLIEDSGSRIALLRYQRFAKSSPGLADYAVSLHPENCHAWWWRSEIRQTVSSWREGLAICSRNGEAWLRLADLLSRSGSTDDLSPALEAYERACGLGDPGANACWRGGHLASRLGQNRRAVQLFRRSRLPQAREQAYALTTLGSDCR